MALRELHYGGVTYPVAYEILNPNAPHDLLFLHGWGSNKAVMRQAFGTHLENFRHLYVDMPGFGQSPTSAVLTTHDYAAIMALLLESLSFRKEVIVGHSFGGKVAALLAPKCLVLLSSAGIPAPKPLSVRLKITLFKFLKQIGLGRFYRFFATKDVAGMPQNMYETLKNVVDEDFSDRFAKRNGTTLIFWGESDKATPLASGRRIAELVRGSRFFPLPGDHYFFLRHADVIAQTVQLEAVAES